jgi:hypothetical protein
MENADFKQSNLVFSRLVLSNSKIIQQNQEAVKYSNFKPA